MNLARNGEVKNTAAQRRREALRALCHLRFGGVEAALARAINKPQSQVADMLSDPPRKAFGEKVARDIEKKLRLPYMTLDGGAPADPAQDRPDVFGPQTDGLPILREPAPHFTQSTPVATLLRQLREVFEAAPRENRKAAMAMLESWLVEGNQGALRAAVNLLGDVIADQQQEQMR